MKTKKSVWAYSVDEETYYGACKTRREAIDEGMDELEGDHEILFVGKGHYPDPADYIPDVADIIEHLGDNFSSSDKAVEADEAWPDVKNISEKEAKKLTAYISRWVRKNLPCNFYAIDHSTVKSVRVKKK